MGVTSEELANVYPKLYHMAEAQTWDSIKKYGLLSTSALLDLFEVTGSERVQIESRRRPKSVIITHPQHGRAVIRDQKPLIESKLVRALNGCTAEEWYRILNGRVFFWLNKERLYTLLCAGSYANNIHTVLTLDTLSFVRAYQQRITLSSMNTGNTRPIAHPRGPSTFLPLGKYPFQERANRGSYYRVVELATEYSVPDISKYVLRVDAMTCADDTGRIVAVIFEK